MINIYYTATEGRRNANGHTRTKGTVYKIGTDKLINIGDYSHLSGGAGIEASILQVCERNGININGGYCKDYRKAINLIQL